MRLDFSLTRFNLHLLIYGLTVILIAYRFVSQAIPNVAATLNAKEAYEVVHCGCIGCCKPAPPVCCDPACPKCLLPTGDRGETRPRLPEYPRMFPKDESVDLPLNIPVGQAKRHENSFLLKNNLGNSAQVDMLLNRERFAIPDLSCAGGQCPCAQCVCCFTATILCTTTTTCTLSETRTRTFTETDEVISLTPTIVTESSSITFTVYDSTIFQQTSVTVTTDPSFTTTTTSTSNIFVSSTSTIILSTILVSGGTTTLSASQDFFITFRSTELKTISTQGFTVLGSVTMTSSVPFFTGISFNPIITIQRSLTSFNSLIVTTVGATPVTTTIRDFIFTPEVNTATVISTIFLNTELRTSSLTITDFDILRTRTLRTSTIRVGFTSTRVSPTVSITCTESITTTTNIATTATATTTELNKFNAPFLND